jgi:hypothetical protein
VRAILAAVLALSVLAGTGAAFAADYPNFPNDFWKEQRDRLP